MSRVRLEKITDEANSPPVRSFGPVLCAAIAMCVSLPALAIPFMSDDWINLATVSGGVPMQTPFGYVRPLYLASYWAELHVWGLRPVPFHVTNVLLIAACAAMVVVVVTRFTGDALWATVAGVLFALHPYHVENAAWIAARADSASLVFLLISLLAYDKWARRGSGVPLGALAAFEVALLFKESVSLFPAMLFVLRTIQSGPRLKRSEVWRGIAPMVATAAVHWFIVRPAFLGDGGLARLRTLGLPWIKRGVDFFTAAFLPVHAERVEAHPIIFAGAALALLSGLAVLARRHLRGRERQVVALIVLFAAGVAPSLLSFQERYFLLPSAISGTALAYLLLHTPRRIASLAWIVVLTVWIGSLGAHWRGWLEAGKVSGDVVAGLTAASRLDGVGEIVVANLPYRVAGMPVGADLATAVRLSGGASVRVRAATSLDLPTGRASGIDGSLDRAVARTPAGVQLRIHLRDQIYSGIFLPLRRPPGTTLQEDYATLAYDDFGGVTVTIPRREDGSRVAFAWYDGELNRLF